MKLLEHCKKTQTLCSSTVIDCYGDGEARKTVSDSELESQFYPKSLCTLMGRALTDHQSSQLRFSNQTLCSKGVSRVRQFTMTLRSDKHLSALPISIDLKSCSHMPTWYNAS